MIQTSIWFVPSIKENNKKLLAGSPHNDKRESSGIPRMPRAVSPSSLKNLRHFDDNHDVNHPGPGRRGFCHLDDLLALTQLAALESVA
jgi:hypothetical protein